MTAETFCSECWLRKLNAIDLDHLCGDAAWNIGRKIAAQVAPAESELPKNCTSNIDFMSGFWAGIGRSRQWISERVAEARNTTAPCTDFSGAKLLRRAASEHEDFANWFGIGKPITD